MKRVRERRAEYLAHLARVERADDTEPVDSEPVDSEPVGSEREQGREESSSRAHSLGEAISAELDGLFAPAAKHVHERKEWVAVAKFDDRESGAGSGIDLDSGVIELPRHNTGACE